MDAPTVTTPLLSGVHHGADAPPRSGAVDRKPAPTPQAAPATAPLAVNRVQRTLINVLAALHAVRGVLLLACPALGLGLPGLVALPPFMAGGGDGDGASAALVAGALLGAGDVLLSGLLATADRRSDREVRRALAVNLVSDALDTFVLIFAAACWRRHRVRSPVAEIGAVATLAIVEHITLWTMAADHPARAGRPVASAAAYQARLQASEDKKLRLDMWFADMRRDEEMRRVDCPAMLGK